jgi:hypothetical protein
LAVGRHFTRWDLADDGVEALVFLAAVHSLSILHGEAFAL